MDLHFDTPEAALQCAKNLRTWGQFMEENADKQITGAYFFHPDVYARDLSSVRVCAIGAGVLACRGDISMNDPEDDLDEVGISMKVRNAVGDVVARQQGINVEATMASVPFLNDQCGVTFPQFATACRTLAAMIEEQFVVESAPVAECEMVGV